MQRRLITKLAAIALSGDAATALADSTPVGPPPASPVSTIEAQHGELVALAVPKRAGGRVWHVAPQFDAKVLRQVSEANVGSSVVLVFRAGGIGPTMITLALTKDDASAKALESRRLHVRVR